MMNHPWKDINGTCCVNEWNNTIVYSLYQLFCFESESSHVICYYTLFCDIMMDNQPFYYYHHHYYHYYITTTILLFFSTDLIGQGAYGIVYKGIQTASGDTVAIKRIPFADSTPEGGVPCNVIREISLLRELDHPNVVQLLDIIQAGAANPGLYLVFEYVAHDLKTFMDKYQTSDEISERVGLPVPMVRSFLRQILAGVGFCHTYRVLHRDLKPHNVSNRILIM